MSGVLNVMGTQATKCGPAEVGETVALGKLETAQTGDTLKADKAPVGNLFKLSPPEPVMAFAVAPGERKDEVKLSAALTRIVEEDPSLMVEQLQDTGKTLLRGQGEMHLRVALERLTGKYDGIQVGTGQPHVPYKETIRGKTSVRGRHKKQSGGHRQFGDVVLTIAPLPRGEGIVFSDTITGGVVPKQYIPSVEAGVKGLPAPRSAGLSRRRCRGDAHRRVLSHRRQLRSGLQGAAQVGMREGMEACKPVLLEPIMEVTLNCPSERRRRSMPSFRHGASRYSGPTQGRTGRAGIR